MNFSKTRLLVLGAFVITTAVILGTLLWLKLTPQRHGQWNPQPLEGLVRQGTVPDFSLIERSGKKITLADFRGKSWIADFIYTTCTDTCPLQSAEMMKLQEELNRETNLKLVSFSVDPERDTPAVLSQYARRFKADGDRWLFLTGDKEQISHLIQSGFRLSAALFKGGEGGDPVILHSPRFVLVDRNAEIRGYYDSREAAAIERLKKDARTLIEAR